MLNRSAMAWYGATLVGCTTADNSSRKPTPGGQRLSLVSASFAEETSCQQPLWATQQPCWVNTWNAGNYTAAVFSPRSCDAESNQTTEIARVSPVLSLILAQEFSIHGDAPHHLILISTPPRTIPSPVSGVVHRCRTAVMIKRGRSSSGHLC
jgi:hypothetical protein